MEEEKKAKKLEVPPAVRHWLKTTFVEDSAGEVSCSYLYECYEDACKGVKLRPAAPNVFGKLLHQVFPEIKRVKHSVPGQKKRPTSYRGITFRKADIVEEKDDRPRTASEVITEEEEEEEVQIIARHGNQRIRFNQWVVKNFETAYYDLHLDLDFCRVYSLTRYLEAFTEVCWPVVPIPWAIVKNNVIIDSIHKGDIEYSVLTFNVCAALCGGAIVVGDANYAKSLYSYCMELLELIHDSCDMNIISVLIHIMSANALLLFPLEKGIRIALSYVSVAEATCEALNATDTELYARAVNWRHFLTRGESEILPTDAYEADERISTSAADHFKQGLDEIIKMRRMGTYIITQIGYLQTRIANFKLQKKRFLSNNFITNTTTTTQPSTTQPTTTTNIDFATTTDPNQIISAWIAELFKRDFKVLKKKGEGILVRLNGSIPRTAFLLHCSMLYSACAEAYAELGNLHKALKFVRLSLTAGEECKQLGCFFLFRDFPKILAEARAWTDLQRFIRLADFHSEYHVPAMLRDVAVSILKGGS